MTSTIAFMAEEPGAAALLTLSGLVILAVVVAAFAVRMVRRSH